VLQINDLRVRYGPVVAVDGISITVGPSQIVGILGPNGAGKTTTLAAVTGLAHTASGSISFDDTALTGVSPERIMRRGIALVPEGRDIFATLTVAENLRVATAGIRGNADRAAILERELERFPVLRRYYRAQAGNLSGGEQQQLAIARALVSQPRLLLLDEPTLGLSPVMMDLVFETVIQLRAEGMTIVLVEQNATRTLSVVDHVYVLQSGRVFLDGPPQELRDSDVMIDAYLGGGR
jgi:branched-chain amino acid transport system ATP-binding protein